MASRKPGFFCEGCGEKVDKWALQCPSCGKIFDSIKCPECSNTGTAEEFSNGCPVCGFMSKAQKEKLKSEMKASKRSNNNSEISSSFYIIAILMLLIVAGVLGFVFFKLLN